MYPHEKSRRGSVITLRDVRNRRSLHPFSKKYLHKQVTADKAHSQQLHSQQKNYLTQQNLVLLMHSLQG